MLYDNTIYTFSYNFQNQSETAALTVKELEKTVQVEKNKAKEIEKRLSALKVRDLTCILNDTPGNNARLKFC